MMTRRFNFGAVALATFACLCAGTLGARPATALSCLTSAEMRAIIADKKVVPPVEAMHSARGAAPGEVIRVRLCRDDAALIYQVTTVKRDGRVQRVTIDGVSGKVSAVR